MCASDRVHLPIVGLFWVFSFLGDGLGGGGEGGIEAKAFVMHFDKKKEKKREGKEKRSRLSRHLFIGSYLLL